MHTWAQQFGGFTFYPSKHIHIETSEEIPSLIDIGTVTKDSGKFHSVIRKVKYIMASDVKGGSTTQVVLQNNALIDAFSKIQIIPEMRDLSAGGKNNPAVFKVGGKPKIGNVINNGKFVINAGSDVNVETLLSFGDLINEGNGNAKLSVDRFYSGSVIETTIFFNIPDANSHTVTGLTHLTTGSKEGSSNSLQAAGMTMQQFVNPQNSIYAHSKRLTQSSLQNNGDGDFTIVSKTTPVFFRYKIHTNFRKRASKYII